MTYTSEEKGLRITPFDASVHATEISRQWLNDGETCRFNSWGVFPYTRSQQAAYVKTIEDGDPSKIVWAIEMIEGEKIIPTDPPTPGGILVQKVPRWRHVGNCSLQSIDMHNRSAEFAVVIGCAKARGKDYGKTVLGFALDHAFKRLGLHRVWLGTSADNVGMQKCAAANDMPRDGIIKDGMWSCGKFVDVYIYNITEEDYRGSR
jgi:RimJ/RimL family protein N-acetyltransferase